MHISKYSDTLRLKIIVYCSQNILIARRVENIGGHNEQMQLNIWVSQTLKHLL